MRGAAQKKLVRLVSITGTIFPKKPDKKRSLSIIEGMAAPYQAGKSLNL
jgi:hypothetical protein